MHEKRCYDLHDKTRYDFAQKNNTRVSLVKKFRNVNVEITPTKSSAAVRNITYPKLFIKPQIKNAMRSRVCAVSFIFFFFCFVGLFMAATYDVAGSESSLYGDTFVMIGVSSSSLCSEDILGKSS
jgi:hypothetical protein